MTEKNETAVWIVILLFLAGCVGALVGQAYQRRTQRLEKLEARYWEVRSPGAAVDLAEEVKREIHTAVKEAMAAAK